MYSDALRALIRDFDTLLQRVGRSFLEVRGPFLAFMERWQHGERLLKAGWVPHPILFSIEEPDEDKFRQQIEPLWRQHWPAFQINLVERVKTLDSMAGPVLIEATQLHQLGYYRSVPRLLLPECEAVVRRRFGVPEVGTDTQLKSLRDRLGAMPLQEHGRPIDGLWLFSMLEGHLVDHVRTQEQVDRFKASGIPNRHACIHGIIDYRTFQSSMNAILMALYVFEMVEVATAGAQQEATS